MSDLVGTLVKLLGRDRAWRLGRSLYMRARGEKAANAIAENGEAALIARAVLAGDPGRPLVFLDVGANLGEWSETALVAAAAAGRALEIHLFEPTPSAGERLESVFSRRAGATVHRLALSDRSGTAQFSIFGATAGTNSLESDPDAAPAQTLEVATARGADFAAKAGLDAVDLVKIDTEGHDYLVLAGFEPLLARGGIGAAQFEYNSRWLTAHRGLRDVFDLAARTGYRLGRVMPDRIELIGGWNPECDRFFEDNFVLVRSDMVSALGGVEMRWSVSNTLEPAGA